MRALHAGVSHKMTAWMATADLSEELASRSKWDPYVWLIDLQAVLTETDNLLSGKSPLSRWRVGAFDEIEDALLL